MQQSHRDYQRALSELMKYNALTPNFTDYVGDDNILYAIGLCYKGLGDYKNALHFFDSAIEDEISTHSESWVSHHMYFQKARTLHLMGFYDQAIEFYNKTLDSWDGASEAIFYKGIAYKAKGGIDQACKEFNVSSEMIKKGMKSSDPYVALFDEVFLSQISDTIKHYCPYE